MPREIVCFKPRIPVISEYEEKPVEAGQVRVKVEFASPKHGTEMHIFRGDAPQNSEYFDEDYNLFLPKTEQMRSKKYHFVPGNMWVGEIIERAENVTGFEIGQRIAGYGPLRETQTIKAENALIMHDSMTWQEAMCFDPCHFAMGGVRDAYIRVGDTCCIMGLGAIGLMAAQIARLAGARLVVVSDPIAARRAVALENGADIALDPAVQDVGLELKKLTGKLGVDAIVESSGTYAAQQQALRGIAYGGRIAVVGWYSPCAGGLNYGREAHFNNATMFFSRACSEPNPDYPRWSFRRIMDECWIMLSKGLIRCENVINPVVSFEDAGETYLEVVDQHPERSVKMGVTY